jgi:hypothetical protein
VPGAKGCARTSFDPDAGEIPEGLGADTPLSSRWLVLFLAGVGLAVGAAFGWDELTKPPGGDDAAAAMTRP